MNGLPLLIATLLALLAPFRAPAALLPLPGNALPEAFAGRSGALVLIDAATGETQRHQPGLAATAFAPCSTFKVWNTAIGLETGLLTHADQPFWKWDGVQRSLEPWNRDLTLREAYAVSCVPAYQALARRIGPARMNAWLHKLGYGNADTTAGNDVFWLPAPGRTPLLISPDQQAILMRRLATGDVPFSAHTQSTLKDIMTVQKTPHGTLYGKTGTSGRTVVPELGWFVGYLETGSSTLAFACLLTGPDATGKAARTLIEQLFNHQGWL